MLARIGQSSADVCTQGPAVRFGDGSFGFLTNAHCTRDHERLNGVQIFQPSRVSTNFAGTEAAKPPYRSGWFITNGYLSDAVFVRTAPGVELQAKAAMADGCDSHPDNLFLDRCFENGTVTDIVGTASYLAVNTVLFKTGRSSGTTAGTISQTCVDLRGEDPDGKTGPPILCNSRVASNPNVQSNGPRMSAGGDSGSPVLLSQPVGGANRASLAGLHWGGRDTYFTFSPWENIWQGERAGTRYGLAVTALTGSWGTVTNPEGGSSQPPPPSCPDPETEPDVLPPPECRV